MDALYKYPRTLHLPFTEHKTTDDKVMSRRMMERVFVGSRVVVTEKLDGENTTLYPDHYHARSLDGDSHPSQYPARSIHGAIKSEIPSGWRICGENVYAEHSIHYLRVPPVFYVFAVFNERNVCLSWDETAEIASMLSLPTVPVLYDGVWDEEKVRACMTGTSALDGFDAKTYKETGKIVSAQEGYVVRVADAFEYPERRNKERQFFTQMAKFVRRGHVTTDDFWRKNWKQNGPIRQNVVSHA